MSDQTVIQHAVVNQGANFVCLARVVGIDGDNLHQSDVDSVSLFVRDMETGSSTHTETPTPTDVVFNTLQNDDLWDADEIGYNFRHVVSHQAVPEGDRNYRADYIINTTGGQKIALPFGVEARTIYTS